MEEVAKNSLIVAAISDPIKPTTVANLGWGMRERQSCMF